MNDINQKEASVVDKNKKRNLLITVLVLISIIAISVSVWALFFRDSNPELNPEYAPQKTDRYAEALDDKNDEKLNASEGGGAVSLSYSKGVSINLADKKASVMFQNPTKSTQNMVLQLIVEDGDKETVIAQSDLIPAGYKINTLALLTTAKLSEGGYNGKFKVLYYHADSGEKAVVNTEIPVDITAK